MLRNYIHWRERRWHARDKNRFPRQFEWGTEHLGLSDEGNPQRTLELFVKEALADSDSFYACEPASDYNFNGETLKFSSAVQTPYEVNNVVWGRLFPANSNLAVVVLPQWNAQWDSQVALCRILQGF